MKMNGSLRILIIIFIFSCEPNEDKLFWIDERTEHRNDLLFLVESTNIARLQGDSLKSFITQSEFDAIESPPTIYKNFGQICERDNFTAFVLLQEIDTIGRNYHFLVRTYDKKFKIIDSFEFGTWDEKQKRFCFGSINKDLIIGKKCEGIGTKDIMQITEDGKIIMTSYHKP